MATTIKLKNGSGAPLAGDLVAGEPALDLTNKRLYTEDSGGTVIEVGTNPSTLTVDTTTLVVDAGNNRVGIGTASPAVKTQIVGSGAIFRISDDVSTSGTIDISASSSEAVINANTYASAVPLVFKNASTERMRITSSGNVGIGNIGSNAKLEVTATSGEIFRADASGGAYRIIANQTGVNMNGNVGIGTTSPSSTLHLYGTGTPIRLNIEATTGRVESRLDNTSGAFIFGIDDSGGAGFGSAYSRNIYSNGAYPMLFWTNNAERMRITSSGNVGIGTSSPSTLIEAQSTDARITLTHTGGNSLQLYQQATLSYLMIDDSLSIYTNSAERMKINSSGNVGIGTSSPVSKLHVRDVIRVSTSGTGDTATDGTVLSVGASGEAYLYNYESQPLIFATSNAERMRIDSSGDVSIGTTSCDFQSGNRTVLQVEGTTDALLNLSDGTSHFYLHQQGGTSGIDIWNAANSYMRFATNNAERMRIDSSGNVGIGTTTTINARLTVQADGNNVSTFLSDADGTYNPYLQTFHEGINGVRVLNSSSYGGTASNYTQDVAANYIVKTGGTERMRIDTSGNVQIGTGSGNFTDALLTTRQAGNVIDWGHSNTAGYGSTLGSSVGSGAPFIGFSCGAGTTSNTFKTTGIKGSLIHTDNNGALLFSRVTTANADNQTATESMRIDSSGNLLVGTTSGVSGDRITCSVTSGVKNGYAAVATTTAGGTSLVNRNSSNVYVGGVSFSNTATSFPTSSDQRLKENIVDAPAGNIDAIRVRSFNWKADGSHQTYGMVAQELVDVAPEAVTQGATDDDMWGVDYSKLVPMMIKEIQDLRARVAQLEGA